MADEEAIPEPQGLPLIGNVKDVDPEFPLGSLLSMADRFGEIYRLRIPGSTVVIVTTQKLVNETCDEKRFKKSVRSVLSQVRNGVHDGLFTAKHGEENWGIAHRILMPAFGPLSIRNMFDEMHDVATQLTLKWARYGSNTPIAVTDDFTRLTLDTLALCSMGFRFNSFYSPVLHPFIQAMGDFLVECGNRRRRLPLPSFFYRGSDQKFADDISVLRTTAREVLESRKAGQNCDRHDLLSAMLDGVDTVTGKKMTDDSIMDNLITFLIAGHETTSGLLSFAFLELLNHPECFQKAQQEVDRVCGKGTIKAEHMSKLPYLSAVLRETLRLNATIPAFAVEPFEDTLLGGKYAVKSDETIVNLLAKSHLDPLVFGDTANEFVPERMLDAEFDRLTEEFPNCWKPFGNGMRACIGRPFAWQEALLVMAMLLQNFNFVIDPTYQRQIKQTLTIKPKDMHMRAVLREGLTPTNLERRLAGLVVEEPTFSKAAEVMTAYKNEDQGIPLTVLFGSNSGTCEALARRVASDATSHGFHAAKVDCLDSANQNLPADQPIVIITASYEGNPPDNAGHFVAWIESMEKENAPLKDVNYAVFGCGNRDWVQTFHRIPKLVDAKLNDLGGTRLAEIGLTDVSTGEVFTDFEAWEDEVLWPSLKTKYKSQGPGDIRPAQRRNDMKVEITTPRTSTLRQELQEATVVDARALNTPSSEQPEVKKHLEIKLPEGLSYQSGDYLAVLPINPKESVHRAMRCLRLPRDAHLNITTNESTSLPINENVSAYDLLSSYVELGQPATKRNLLALLEAVNDEGTRAEIARLSGDAYSEEITSKRVSVLDVLERFPDIQPDISLFLSMLPPMRVRQYSISSSPLWNPDRVTLTFSVLNSPSLSGSDQRYMGVASTYLDSLSPSDILHVGIRKPSTSFRLPSDTENIPIICIAAGTGIAPFRAFVQERAHMITAGRTLAPALLFFGCRSREHDDLYREELEEWEALGAVSIRRAYSLDTEASEGCRHVHDRMWHDRDEIVGLWRKDAKVFVCGSRAMANSARAMAIKIRMEMERQKGADIDKESAEEWIDSLRNVRYVMDVFD